MKKEITIATFNVCSGVFVPDDTNSFNQDKSPEIDKSFLDKIISIINEEEIDIIAFQEIITTEHVGYIDAITKQTDLKYSCILELSECHLVENVNCGVATLSRHPITEERSIFFTNPNLSVTSKSGSTYHSFEKGMQKMKITIGDKLQQLFFCPLHQIQRKSQRSSTRIRRIR